MSDKYHWYAYRGSRAWGLTEWDYLQAKNAKIAKELAEEIVGDGIRPCRVVRRTPPAKWINDRIKSLKENRRMISAQIRDYEKLLCHEKNTASSED